MIQSSSPQPASVGGNFLLYTAPDGAVKVEVFLQGETVWLTQEGLAELFGVKRQAVTKHLLNIPKNGQLVENSVISILEHTAADVSGTRCNASYLNSALHRTLRLKKMRLKCFKE